MSYFKTPGVYIKEQDAFGSSVVAVPTAVPAFIGYTQRAEEDGNSLLMKPTKVRSLAEYREMFGGGNRTTFKISETGDIPDLAVDTPTLYYTYSSLRLFWANGGGEAFIVSIGTYGDAIDSEKMLQALDLLTKEQEPTIIVVPDAVLLDKDDCYSVYKAILQHCGAKMKSRVGLVDVWGGYENQNQRRHGQGIPRRHWFQLPRLFRSVLPLAAYHDYACQRSGLPQRL
jgi:hypothetical protein